MRNLTGELTQEQWNYNINNYPKAFRRPPKNAAEALCIVYHLLGKPSITVITNGQYKRNQPDQPLTTWSNWRETVKCMAMCEKLVFSNPNKQK